MNNQPLNSLKDFELLFDDYPAEKLLLKKCLLGEPAIIPTDQQDNTVRASFLRFLALGGDELASVSKKGVQLWNACVEGDLNFNNEILPNNLGLINCQLNAIDLRDCTALRSVSFFHCDIKGLNADRMKCKANFFLKDGCTVAGTVRLFAAKIDGDFECDGSKFNGMGYEALNCEQAIIKGNVRLGNGFTAFGTVNFMDVKKIGGSLICRNGHFIGNCDEEQDVTTAILGDRAKIDGGVYLDEKFIAEGGVRLSDARIGSELNCDGGTFSGDGGEALICELIKIKGSVCLRNKFNANGAVNFMNAQIDGSLTCSNASLKSGKDGYAFAAENMTIAKNFSFHDLLTDGFVALASSEVDSLALDFSSWHLSGVLGLDGFVYDKLVGKTPTDAETLLVWLDKQSPECAGLASDGEDFKPQPWQQLQKVLYEMGHFESMRLVAIEFQKRRLKANQIGQTPKDWGRNYNPIIYWLLWGIAFGIPMQMATGNLCVSIIASVCLSLIALLVQLNFGQWIYQKIARGLHRLYGLFLSYGYYTPFRLLITVLIVWLAFGGGYWCAALNGVFSPSNPLIFQNPVYNVCKSDKDEAKFELHEFDCTPPSTQGAGNWYLCSELRAEYTGFSPFAYSLDLILPLVDLQQENDWAPMIPTPNKTSAVWTWSPNWEYAIRFLMWFEILFGWVYSLLLVAVVSGLTKRRDE